MKGTADDFLFFAKDSEKTASGCLEEGQTEPAGTATAVPTVRNNGELLDFTGIGQ